MCVFFFLFFFFSFLLFLAMIAKTFATFFFFFSFLNCRGSCTCADPDMRFVLTRQTFHQCHTPPSSCHRTFRPIFTDPKPPSGSTHSEANEIRVQQIAGAGRWSRAGVDVLVRCGLSAEVSEVQTGQHPN